MVPNSVGNTVQPGLLCSGAFGCALRRLADAANATLDLTAMYMDLLGTADRKLYDASEMKAFGAQGGSHVYAALKRAAQRSVRIRILLGTLDNPLNSTEVRSLLQYPSVQARTWEPKKWYDGGIMHLKLWHADGIAAYLGSANADWKSLAQVKELGVLINGSVAGDGPGATDDLGRIFEVFWEWAAPSLPADTVNAVSTAFQTTLTVPPWDPAVPAAQRLPAPFALGSNGPLAALTSQEAQLQLCDDHSAATASANATAFLSVSPGGAQAAGRTADIDALLYTIYSATSTLSLSVMDFLPATAYGGGHGGAPAWWPALVDAILAVAYAKPVRVRLLVSHWEHTSRLQLDAVRQLAGGLSACSHYHSKWDQPCAGSLEVGVYEVPGWNETTSAYAKTAKAWPSYTRVNHAKYIVSDSRLNIGTSNWEWGYFHQTAGASYNTNASALIAAAQAVFDADWNSSYTWRL